MSISSIDFASFGNPGGSCGQPIPGPSVSLGIPIFPSPHFESTNVSLDSLLLLLLIYMHLDDMTVLEDYTI